jgi:hypothetical protein
MPERCAMLRGQDLAMVAGLLIAVREELLLNDVTVTASLVLAVRVGARDVDCSAHGAFAAMMTVPHI